MNKFITFFDKGLIQNVVVSLVFLFLSFALSSKTSAASSSGKGWKAVFVISWFMILSGFYVFILNFPNGGFHNPYSGPGFCLFFLGIPLRYLGKFFIWWHK